MNEMSSKQFEEWQAYYNLDPFMPERADHHAALIAMHVDKQSKRKGKVRLRDYLIFRTPKFRTAKQSAQDVWNGLLTMFGLKENG